MFHQAQRKLLVLSSLGGVLEFYDFIIYALLSGYIAKAFFPIGNDVVSLLVTFATFSVGYLARPVGGVLFGHFGDRLGRKKTFTISILMMALATFLIGLVPSYKIIGFAAPIILTLLRIVQGLSVGGEIPGAIAYVSESIPNQRGRANGIIFFALINGITLGSLVQAILTGSLTETAMSSYGFRIPFFIGGIFGFLGYLLRRQLDESPIFQKMEDHIETFPLVKVFQKRFLNTIAATFIVGFGASIITLLFLFPPAYLSKVLHISAPSYIWYNTVAIFLVTLLNILFGVLAERYNQKYLILTLSFLAMILAFPIFIIYSKHFSFVIIALLANTLLTGIAWGVIPSLLSGLFPTTIRYSGIAVSYNLGFAIFGGLTPLIATFLVYKTHLLSSPAFYLIFTAILAGISVFFIKQQKLEE